MVAAAEFLKVDPELDFDTLHCISGVDWPDNDPPAVEVVYHLTSLTKKHWIVLKTRVGGEGGSLPTLETVWKAANWHEREAYDMMGIRFAGHPDLRRILMWEGYPYFPLRKDFPLAGKPSEMPDVAFSDPAPLEGGPFVTVAGGGDSTVREPRMRNPEG